VLFRATRPSPAQTRENPVTACHRRRHPVPTFSGSRDFAPQPFDRSSITELLSPADFHRSPQPCPAKDKGHPRTLLRAPPSTEEGGDMTDPNAIQPSELDQLPDRDPEETAEWQASLDAVTAAA